MRNPPVHWHEGLFLRPHHFQAAERHWAETIQTREIWNNPYHYGIEQIEFSREALSNHQFQVHVLHARLPDGTIVSLDRGQEPDRVNIKDAVAGLDHALADLSEAFEKKTAVRVYLALPKLKTGLANVAANGSAQAARYGTAVVPVQDESQGGNDQEIEFRTVNVRLMLSTQDLSGYDLLPIAQIKRAGGGEAIPSLDEEYIPPVLAIDAWPGLGRDIVRAIYDVVGQKIEVLSEQIVSRGVGLDSRHPGDLDRVLMLSALNEAFNTLGVLSFAKGIHPLVAYTELCRIGGSLAIFSNERRLADLPLYDHDDLARIFREIRIRIERLIHSVRDYEYQQRFFVGVGLGLQVSLEPQWFNADWQWYIGVRKGDLAEQEVRDLLSPGQLDWKLGSAQQVEILFQNRAEGLAIRPLDRAIRALPGGKDWIFYEVPKKEGPAWRDVQMTKTLAMRLRDTLITNRDRLQGERQLVVNAHGKSVPLEFALFAVPERN